jgi:hypothetical protein
MRHPPGEQLALVLVHLRRSARCLGRRALELLTASTAQVSRACS